MIDALINGRLIRDPITKIGASGNPYITLLLSVPIGDADPVIVSGIAFGEVSEKIARLKKGDALSVTGSLSPKTWEDKTTNQTKTGFNLTVSAALTAYDIKKRRGNTTTKPADTHNNQPFNDGIPF